MREERKEEKGRTWGGGAEDEDTWQEKVTPKMAMPCHALPCLAPDLMTCTRCRRPQPPASGQLEGRGARCEVGYAQLKKVVTRAGGQSRAKGFGEVIETCAPPNFGGGQGTGDKERREGLAELEMIMTDQRANLDLAIDVRSTMMERSISRADNVQ